MRDRAKQPSVKLGKGVVCENRLWGPLYKNSIVHEMIVCPPTHQRWTPRGVTLIYQLHNSTSDVVEVSRMFSV